MLDLVIRNGLIVDGSGLPGRHGDVSIQGGRIVAVGGRAAVKKITLDPATIWGLKGRGLLTAGNAADVVVFDAEHIGRGPEIASNDFPGGGVRWIRHQEGVDTVIVNGEPTWSAVDGYVAGARAGQIATRECR